MNEIEKLYKNCNLLKPHAWSCKLDRIGEGKVCELEQEVLHCKNCKHSQQEYYHKPFTAEKELKLIKWFAHSGHFCHQTDYLPWLVDDIARNINFIWDILTEEEKQQINEVLE